jgi:putative RecB family exonuclease
MAYLGGVENLRLSPSRVTDFTNCPQLYKYRNIDKLPQPPSIDAERGTLVHSVLHNLFDAPAQKRNLANAIEILPGIWQAQLAAKPDLAPLISNEKEWLDRANALLANYFNLEKPETFEPSFRELHLEFDLAANLYLHGYVDRLDVAPTGEVRIIDYKTGKSPKPGWEAKALFQLQVYALLYFKTEGVLPKLLMLIYLGDSALVRSVPTMADLVATENTLLRIAKEINVAIEKDNWPTKASRLCDWCSFKPICPAHI